MAEIRLCPKCEREKPLSRFRRRQTASVAGGPDVWCRSCERDHWQDRTGTVDLLRGLREAENG